MFRSAMHVVLAATLALLAIAAAIIIAEEAGWRRKQAAKGPISMTEGRPQDTPHVE